MSRQPSPFAQSPGHSRGSLFHNESYQNKILRHLRFLFRSRVLIVLVLLAITLSVTLFNTRGNKVHWSKWNGPIYSFDTELRPGWMDVPSSTQNSPLLLRVAVLSHPKEVNRRQLIRDHIFKGVRSNEVNIEYRFIVGLHKQRHRGVPDYRLQKEHEQHGDLVILNFKDSYDRLSEKRYAALKWSGSFSSTSYDYFMNMDSDTFVRFDALARRLPTILEGKNTNPREQSVMIARMRGHYWHWLPTVSDDKINTTDVADEDLRLDGPWYDYPIGIGYMLSSFLVTQLLSTQPPLPHHIHFPNDDVMIGSWISSLKNFGNPDHAHDFQISAKNPWNVAVKVQPEPLLPHRVNTIIINDHGWHDYPGRANVEEIGGSIGWNSVCIHHIKEKEIKLLRQLDSFRGEWD